MKKIISSTLVFFIFILIFSFPVTAHEKQVIKNHWASNILNIWHTKGLLNFEGDKGPNKLITRGEFIALVNNTFNFKETKYDIFTDVQESDWYWEDIARAGAAGYIQGVKNNDGSLEVQANKSISRQDAATIICRVFDLHCKPQERVLQFVDEKEIAPYAFDSLAFLVKGGYISGFPDKTIKPKKGITLAEAVTILENTAGEIINKDDTYSGEYSGNMIINLGNVTLKNVTVNGDLILTEGITKGAVTLDNVNVKGKTVIRGGTEKGINIINSNLSGEMIISKKDGKVGITVLGSSQITKVILKSGAQIKVNFNDGLEFTEIEGINKGQVIEIEGKFKKVVVNSSAKGAEIYLSKDTSVDHIDINAEVNVYGKGAIETAKINVNGVNLELKPKDLQIGSGVTVTVVGQTLNDKSIVKTQLNQNNVTSGNSSTPSGGGDSGGAYPATGGNTGEGNNNYNESDPSDVLKAKEELSIGSGEIYEDILLPPNGYGETVISWESNTPEVVSNDGKVFRPEYGQADVGVILTATITKGKYKETKIFNVTVKAKLLSQVNNFQIEGYKSQIDYVNNKISLFLPNNINMNNVKINVSFEGKSIFIQGTELIDGQVYNFENWRELKQIEVVSSAHDKKTYDLRINIIDTGIPTVTIVTYGQEIDRNNKIEAFMAIQDGSIDSYEKGLYTGEIKLRGRGNTSWAMPKKSYAISVSDSVYMLDMPEEENWVLIANYADKTLMRNYLAYNFADLLQMEYSPRMRFVDLFLNGEYLGNYLLGEKIKISENRVPIHKMKKSDKEDDTVTGGYIIEKDGIDRLKVDDVYFQTDLINGQGVFAVKEPKSSKINQIQLDYIKNYFIKAEQALYHDKGYENFFHVDTIIDWYLVNEVFKNVDANFSSSVYLYKNKNDKIKMGPVWDFDIGAGNINYSDAISPEGFYIKNSLWISKFFEDHKFIQQVKQRWAEIRNDQIEALFNLIDQTSSKIELSQQTNFERWPILGIYVWPNADGWNDRTTYSSEVEFLKEWLNRRVDWLDRAIMDL